MLKPFGDRILVEPLEAETTTPGGIILSDGAKEKPQSGIVLDKGDDFYGDELKIGDTVFYEKYAGDDLKIDGQKVKIIKGDNVIAYLPK